MGIDADLPLHCVLTNFVPHLISLVVVLISLMAQPRLQLAMARDGLLPNLFGRVNAAGNLRMGTLIAGVPMILIATCVPFGYLDDLISAGILVAFSMTNGCLILLRCERPHFMSIGLVVYNVLCFLTGVLLSHTDSVVGTGLAIGSGILTVGTALILTWKCPRSSIFGRAILSEEDTPDTIPHFQAPCVPILPFLGIFVNWKLISELDASGIIFLLVYLGIAVGSYLWFGVKRSIGSSRGWVLGHYEGVSEGDEGQGRSGLIRSISMSRIGSSKKSESSNGYSRISEGDPDASRSGLMRSASMPPGVDEAAARTDDASSPSSSPRIDHSLQHQQTI